MASSIKINSFDQYLLKGKLRSEGFERWRYSFCASSRNTGIEKRFFIEMYLVNPGVSPNVVVIAQKSRVSMGANNDIQQALTGGLSGYDSRFSGQNIIVKPSYLLIKAGVYGENGIQVNKFVPSSKLNYTKNTATFKTDDCFFSSNTLIGKISVSKNDLRIKPEMLCNEGDFSWELHYEKILDSKSAYSSSENTWIPLGIKANFVGKIICNDEEFVVNPEKSLGYLDKSWGEDFSNPYYHISSSRFTSIITGKNLPASYLAIEGELGKNKELVGILCVEDKIFKLGKGLLPGSGIKESHNCTQAPATAEGEKLHWSVSLEKGDYVVDLDIFCKTSEMFVRDYEIPQGKRTLMRILGGGTGAGEVRIYKKVNKNLELLENANIDDIICEFGQAEEVGV